MKKTAAVLLLIAGGLAASLGLSLLNLYWVGLTAGRLAEWILLSVSVLFTAGAALAVCLLQKRFFHRYKVKTAVFFLIAFAPPVAISGAAFAAVRSLPSLAGMAASLLALSWGVTSAVFAAAGAICLGIISAAKKHRG